MMTVTKIEPLSKTRYKVYLDGQFAFTLYKGELSRYHIAEESVIEDDIYDSLQSDRYQEGEAAGNASAF